MDGERTGWICARCNSSNAPWLSTCPECGKPPLGVKPAEPGPRPSFGHGRAKVGPALKRKITVVEARSRAVALADARRRQVEERGGLKEEMMDCYQFGTKP